MKHNNTAILIFANSALEDASRKAIRSSENLFATLTEQTLKIAKASNLPYFHFTENQQIGDSFGKRFTNAIKTVYAQGFDNVITIGNDTPNLTTALLNRAANRLQTKKFILGPSTDGGFYLMGLHKSQFVEGLFLKLPWQSRNLAKSITRLLSANKVNVVHMQVLQDIDTEADVKTILNTFRSISKELHHCLVAIVELTQTFLRKITELITNAWATTHYNKGSPSLLNS